MSTPLDEHALDFLDDSAKKLVKEMLKAVVEHPKIYNNGFTVKGLGRDGFLCFLGNNGAFGPFINNQRLSNDITGSLIYHGIAGPKVNPQWPNYFVSFTETALDWHRRHGGPDSDEIRKLIGRNLRKDPSKFQRIVADALSQEISISPELIREQIEILIGVRLLETHLIGDEYVLVRLSQPSGIMWAESGFPPIASLRSQNINLHLDLRVEVRNTIQEVRSADVSPELLEQFEARLHRLEEELEKPDGNFQPVKDLVETANHSKDLLGPMVKFFYRHWDKIQTLAEASGNVF